MRIVQEGEEEIMSQGDDKGVQGTLYGLQAMVNCCQEIDRRVFNKTLCWMNPEYEPLICKYQKQHPEGKIYECNKYYAIKEEQK